jgi:malate dehydrogenase
VLIDIVEGMPQVRPDLLQAPPSKASTPVWSAPTTADTNLTSSSHRGLPRKPGMSRDDLLVKNTAIVKAVTEQICKYSPNAFLIVVSNPLDAMVYVTHKVSGFPTHRVMGMAGVLDAARFRAFIAMELKVSVEDVNAFVLGGHGDSMVPLARFSTVAGIPLPELLPAERIEALVDRTRKGGGEIVNLLKPGAPSLPFGLRRTDGGIHRQGQEAHPPLCRLLRQGIRGRRLLRRGPGEDWRQWRRTGH